MAQEKWITVNGKHILIKEGQSVSDAMKYSDSRKGKFKAKNEDTKRKNLGTFLRKGGFDNLQIQKYINQIIEEKTYPNIGFSKEDFDDIANGDKGYEDFYNNEVESESQAGYNKVDLEEGQYDPNKEGKAYKIFHKFGVDSESEEGDKLFVAFCKGRMTEEELEDEVSDLEEEKHRKKRLFGD